MHVICIFYNICRIVNQVSFDVIETDLYISRHILRGAGDIHFKPRMINFAHHRLGTADFHPCLIAADTVNYMSLCHFPDSIQFHIHPFGGFLLHLQAHNIRITRNTADFHRIVQHTAVNGDGIYLREPAHIRLRNNIGRAKLVDHLSGRLHRNPNPVRIIQYLIQLIFAFQQFRIDKIHGNIVKSHRILRVADHNHRKPDCHGHKDGNQLQA